jgi:hypothetical protein
MDHHDTSPADRQLSRRALLKGAAAAAGATVLGQGLRLPDALAQASQPIEFWTIATGQLPPVPNASSLAMLPTGLSQARSILSSWSSRTGLVSFTGQGATFLEDTELWMFYAAVDSVVATDQGVLQVGVRRDSQFQFIAMKTSAFYPYPIWDDSGKIITLYLTTGEPYEQAVPATYGVDFPTVVTTFDFVDVESGNRIGTILYSLPDGTVTSSFPVS